MGVEGFQIVTKRNYSAAYERKLAQFKRQQANKRRLARNLRNKWYQRRYREAQRMDAESAEWLGRLAR